MSEGPSSDRSVENICTFLHSDEGPSLETLDVLFLIFSLGRAPTFYSIFRFVFQHFAYAAQNIYNYINYLRFEVNWEDGEDVIART